MVNLHPSRENSLNRNSISSPGLHDLLFSQASLSQDEIAYPLSSMQAGMLFHSLYAQQSGVDIEQLVCTFHESLDVGAFEQAWQQVLQRHPILRTSFHWEGLEYPEQRVHEPVTLEFMQRSWCDLTLQSQQAELQAYLESDRKRGFSFQEAPLMRLAMFQCAPDCYQFVWTIHHILLDGRSFPILLNEVFAIYEALCQKQVLQLAQPRPYKAYIDWLQQQDWTVAEPYWKHYLLGFHAPTPLPGTTPNTTIKPGRQEQTLRLSETTTTALVSLANQHNITPNTIVQGAWALLLSHYSGSDDIVFGATRACRNATVEGSESMVGLFINTLPVRVRVDRGMSLIAWLQDLRSQHIAVRPYEHTPLTQVQQWSQLSPGTPLFESLVVFENYSLNAILQAQGGNWGLREFQLFEQPNYPLILNGNLDVELLLKISYDHHQFTATTITQILEHLQTLLEQIVAQPECQLADLSFLTAADRHRILVEWNATDVDYPQHLRLQDLFEAQVERSPEAIAVVFNGESLTYAELNHRANQLAHYLQRLGVQPEVTVGICIERSLEMIVGLLAIVKAGGAYVPLDPTYPQERLAHILTDSRLMVVLTQEKLLSHLPKQTIPMICLDRDWQVIATETTTNPVSTATSSNLAYIIYTSGSTGKPKGVLIEHRGAVNTILDINRRFHVGAGDRVLAVCSLNFDLSVYDVFGLLATGGVVVVPQPAIAPDLDHWLDLMERHQVTVWNTAPPVMQMLAGHTLDRERYLPACLKLVMLSGDWIPVTLPTLIRQLKNGQEPVAIISLGGATEASIWSIFYPIETVDPSWKSIPYGKPLANQRFYVLNERLHPIPVGEVGELYIGGDGVARGYLNRPDLNATKFIADPFRPDSGTWLYRTGDLGRYMPDGTIEFLGRIDHQVKIRGFRVEIGEIEVVLSQHPAIRETAIVPQDDAAGNKRLVAYLVAERGYRGPVVDEVRDFLKAKLPDYMVPSAFVVLESLPLTPNGKLDRKALPTPDFTNQGLNATSETTFVASRNVIERQLVEIWQECLNVKPIGVTDNFFELGGHSLLAVRLWSKIEKAFDQKLPLATLFQAPTIEQLATRLTQPQAASPLSDCPSLVVIQQGQPDHDKPPLFCIHVLGRGLKFYRPLVKYMDPNQRIYGLSTHIAGEAFSSNQVKDLATHYAQQIRAIQPEGPYLLAGISFGGLVAFEIAQQLGAQNQAIGLLALLDTRLATALKPLAKSEQLAEHWQQLRHKGIGYAFSKVQQRVTGQIQTLLDELKAFYYRTGIKLCQLTGYPLRDNWQDLLYQDQNTESTAGYTPEPYSGQVTLFRASDQLVGVKAMLDPALGWQALAMGGLEIHAMPGNHLGMLNEPHAQVLGKALQSSLAKAVSA